MKLHEVVGIVLLALVIAIALNFSGCATAKKIARDSIDAAANAAIDTAVDEAVSEIEKIIPVKQYKVLKGDCLWDIASGKDVYANPFLWPLIYNANRDVIGNNPNRIEIGQQFKIRTNKTATEEKNAIKEAQAFGE